MNTHPLSRPSLKITRDADQRHASHFIVEVWNPFASGYQVVGSVDEGLTRVGDLANLIGQMWLQRHPKRDVLVDVPEVDEPDAGMIDGRRWAEFRINATAFRSYDTRYDGEPSWASAAGMAEAAATSCARVGCALPRSTTS